MDQGKLNVVTQEMARVLTMSRRAWHVGVAPKGNLAWPADGFNLDSHIKGKEL